MKIRKANKDDIKAISDLYYQTVTTINAKDYTPGQIRVWSQSAFLTEVWERKIAKQHFFIADDEGVVAGFGSVTENGYLDYMYVGKDYQRQGVGSMLMDAIESTAAQFKPDKIWAHVSITARPFFKSKGFEIEKIYTKQVGDVEFEDSVMIKRLVASREK